MKQSIIIPKGSFLYRIRKDEGVPLNKETDWGLPPLGKVKQNRFNSKDLPILYVGTDENILMREVNLKISDKYWIATYKCVEDLCVGCFFSDNIIGHYLNLITLGLKNKTDLFKEEQISIEKHLSVLKK